MSAVAAESVPAQAEAERLYAGAMDKMRETYRHGQSWDGAAVKVVNGMGAGEASAILNYLRAQAGLAEPDVTLANAVAKRLGLVIEWRRVNVVE